MAYAEKYELNEASTTEALNISRCESGFNKDIKNASSSAQGSFQFINSTWYKTMELMNLPTTTPKTDLHIGVEAGIFLYKKDGNRHWLESKPCWGK